MAHASPLRSATPALGWTSSLKCNAINYVCRQVGTYYLTETALPFRAGGTLVCAWPSPREGPCRSSPACPGAPQSVESVLLTMVGVALTIISLRGHTDEVRMMRSFKPKNTKGSHSRLPFIQSGVM